MLVVAVPDTVVYVVRPAGTAVPLDCEGVDEVDYWFAAEENLVILASVETRCNQNSFRTEMANLIRTRSIR